MDNKNTGVLKYFDGDIEREFTTPEELKRFIAENPDTGSDAFAGRLVLLMDEEEKQTLRLVQKSGKVVGTITLSSGPKETLADFFHLFGMYYENVDDGMDIPIEFSSCYEEAWPDDEDVRKVPVLSSSESRFLETNSYIMTVLLYELHSIPKLLDGGLPALKDKFSFSLEKLPTFLNRYFLKVRNEFRPHEEKVFTYCLEDVSSDPYGEPYVLGMGNHSVLDLNELPIESDEELDKLERKLKILAEMFNVQTSLPLMELDWVRAFDENVKDYTLEDYLEERKARRKIHRPTLARNMDYLYKEIIAEDLLGRGMVPRFTTESGKPHIHPVVTIDGDSAAPLPSTYAGAGFKVTEVVMDVLGQLYISWEDWRGNTRHVVTNPDLRLVDQSYLRNVFCLYKDLKPLRDIGGS